MKHYRLLTHSLLLLLAAAFSTGCRHTQRYVPHDSSKLLWMGRTDTAMGAKVIYWSGTSVTMNFEGTEVNAVIRDENGENYFNVIVDSTDIVKFKPGTEKKLYTLVSHLKPGRHTLQLFKLTEGTNGKTWFYSFGLNEGDSVLPPPLPQKRKMEFYGNSITSGYALDDANGDSKSPRYMDNYLSYAALTARHYNAGYHCISKSGIGFMISWFPVIMPELYDRVDPDDSGRKWNFSAYTPDVVVIDLGQNDSWMLTKKDHPQFIARFGTTTPGARQIIGAYKDFVKKIRGEYPKSAIICTLGSMVAAREGSPWPGYIKQAVIEMNDPAIYSLTFPYKNTPGHPKANEHEEMADTLISFIDRHVKW